MMFSWFYDVPAAAIVLGGTLLGTFLRCGWCACGAVLRALAGIGRSGFDADTVRKELAVQIQQIGRDGILRARPRRSGDAEFDEATDALIGHRSIAALIAAHEEYRARRVAQATAAVGTLLQAAELAPVFGLAGTLVSLSRLPANGIERSAYLVAIGMAVHATLYGLVAANLLLMPLAGVIERAAIAEEQARQKVVDWLAERLALACPQAAPLLHSHARDPREVPEREPALPRHGIDRAGAA